MFVNMQQVRNCVAPKAWSNATLEGGALCVLISATLCIVKKDYISSTRVILLCFKKTHLGKSESYNSEYSNVVVFFFALVPILHPLYYLNFEILLWLFSPAYV